MNVDALKNLTPQHRKIAAGVTIGLTLLLAGNFLIRPQITRISELKAEVTQLSGELTVYQAKIKRLDQLIQENKRLQGLLEQQKRQLPDTHEVDNLLKQVTDAGARAGMNFKLWRPGSPAQHPNGLYQELPVDVEIEGLYHQIGVFFEFLGQLDRIVNVKDLSIKPIGKDGARLRANFVTTAFAAPAPAPPANPAAAKKGK
ncbi:MAG: type 4a pilus biogenesis protein PilO [Nitrospirota bacterium]|nr:type 4a pilus biogenesis protein PilO [Nitrospirota bacterium]